MKDVTSSHRTPIEDSFETCERAAAVLSIYSGSVHPDEVTQVLQLEPTRVTVLNRSSINSLGLSRVEPLNAWFFSSEQAISSRDLRRHLDWVLSLLEHRAALLRQLQQREGVTMAMACLWWSRFGDGGPVLWPEQMRRLADLNLECSIAFSYFGGEMDAGELTPA